MPVLRILCVLFIEFIRGVPLITLLFVASTMLNYFLPPGTVYALLVRVLIMVTLFASAYMAEVIRGGLQAVAQGQHEAGDSLGLTYWQAHRLIILPQAIRIVLPAIGNQFVYMLKMSSLVSVIGLTELTRRADELVVSQYRPLEIFQNKEGIYFQGTVLTHNQFVGPPGEFRQSDHRH